MKKNTHLKPLLLLITLAAGCQASYAQKNIVRVSMPRTPINNNKQLDNLRPNKDSVESTYQYYDGLGRLIQTVQYQGSPQGNDLVQPVVYDQYGRDSVKYLPYTIQSKTPGSYQPNAVTGPKGYQGSDQYLFYQDGKGYVQTPFPFAQTVYEASPLNRTLEQGAPGDNWQPFNVPGTADPGHTVKMDYASNDQSTFDGTILTNNPGSRMALLFTATINADQSQALSLPLQGAGGYSTGELSLTISKDENWQPADGCIGTVETYTDKESHVILKRTYNQKDTTVEMLSTYYVYDDLGHLAFVIPPLAQADQNGLPDQQTLDNLCYQYRYDERGRMGQKKLPGKGWEYMVYNTMDQVVATQDSLQRARSQWIYTKYDALGRAVITGIYQDTSGMARAQLQDTVNSYTTLWETPVAALPADTIKSLGRRNIDPLAGYTGTAWPAGSSQPLTVNYYDNYTGIPSLPVAYTAPAGAATSPTGAVTATFTALLSPLPNKAETFPGNSLLKVMYYDDLGRAVKTYADNIFTTADSASFDAFAIAYNFSNGVTSTLRQHYNTKDTISRLLTISNNYSYDHMGRKTQTWEQISTDTITGKPTLLSQNIYNELGQLQTKQLHSTDSVSFLEDVNYAYNERGWMYKQGSELFSEGLQYNLVKGTAVPQYNGNIAVQFWSSLNSDGNSYNYTYDRLNRLTSGITADSAFAEKGIGYDMGGNITNLSRTYSGVQTDSLQYRYNGNLCKA